MAAKQEADITRSKKTKQICATKSKMFNYLYSYKSLSCSDTTVHFRNVNVKFLSVTEMFGLPSTQMNAVNPRTEFLLLWKLEIFLENREGMCAPSRQENAHLHV